MLRFKQYISFKKKIHVIVLHCKQRCINLHGKSIFLLTFRHELQCFVNDLKRERNVVLYKCGN